MGGGDLVETAGKQRREGRITAEGDQAVGERFEEMLGDGRGLLGGDRGVGVRRGVSREQLTEVGVAAGVLDEEQERMRFRRDIGAPVTGTEFDAEDGFEAGFLGGQDELDDAVEVARVGQGDGRAMVLGGQGDDIFRRKG
jgi:hypothetical protein